MPASQYHFCVDHSSDVAVIVVSGAAKTDLQRALQRALNTDEKSIGSWLYALSDLLNNQPTPQVTP